ncbi:hypothetical protein D9M73_162430 [compost metagenome]
MSIGSSETMVVSKVAPLLPPLTRLPSLISLRLMRPLMGAVMRVNSSSRRALASTPSALSTSALAAARACRRWS